LADKTNYSTTSEADALYVNVTGDTITGSLTIVSNLVVGTGTATGLYAVAEGLNSTASGNGSHAEGGSTTASGDFSHAAGSFAKATNDYTYVWSSGADFGSSTTKQYTVYAQNGTRLLGGKVGVGVSNPNAKLHVSSEDASQHPFLAQVGGLTKFLVASNGNVMVGGNFVPNPHISPVTNNLSRKR